GIQCGLHQRSKLRIARIDEAFGFGNSQISNARGIDVAEWLDLTPSNVRLDLAIVESVVQCRPQNGPRPIGRGTTSATSIIVVGVIIAELLFIPLAGPHGGGGLRVFTPPVPQPFCR